MATTSVGSSTSAPVSLSGLATGLDTNSLISQLIAAEQQPLLDLQAKEADYQNQLSAVSSFNGQLNTLLGKFQSIDTSQGFLALKTSLSTNQFFSATASSDAVAGNYNVKVFNLAQVEKDVSDSSLGYTDKDAQNFGTGTINLTDNGTTTAINIDGTNNSLSGIASAINGANAGVTATLINDGSQYRMVLTGNTVNDKNIQLDASGLSGGTYANPTFSQPPVQTAQAAKISVDGITITSDTNTVTGAIPGVTLNLTNADGGATTVQMGVSDNTTAISGKINALVSAYNSVVKFINQNAGKGGTLDGDFTVRSVKNRLQSLLVTSVGSGNFSTLSQLGLETQRDGTLSVNSTTLDNALQNNLSDVVNLLDGSNGSQGIAAQFESYLSGITDSSTGIYATRQQSTNSIIKNLDQEIANTQDYLDQKEKQLKAQFTAMETMVGSMNAQSSYLTQQIAAWGKS